MAVTPGLGEHSPDMAAKWQQKSTAPFWPVPHSCNQSPSHLLLPLTQGSLCSPSRDHTGFKFTVDVEMLEPLSFLGAESWTKAKYQSKKYRNSEV